jgi:5'-nucleotidase / UDP-sugar diphosphatase
MTKFSKNIIWLLLIFGLFGCHPQATEIPNHLRPIKVLYTNDEHGWMEGVTEGMGAANLMAVWQEDHGYTPDDGYMILSGGDMWTGAAISTWFEGASMVQVMNAMDYSAAAVGNHEFDFGLDRLSQRKSEMAFPLLSANIRYKSGGDIPTDLGIQAFSVIEVSGVKVGVIGLTTISTPQTTLPEVVAPFDFIEYEAALREVVPQVLDAGADMIMVIAHVCRSEVEALAVRVIDLQISLIGGGHCNNFFSKQKGETVLISGGSHMQSFAYAEFLYDIQTDEITILDHGVASNRPLEPVEELSTLIDEWRSEADLVLDQVIGYTQKMIPQRSNLMEKLVIEPWLLAYPNADVAITNKGGIRSGIIEGEITVGDIITVLPFENTIIEVELTGEELLRTMRGKRHKSAMAGVAMIGGQWMLTKTNNPLDPQQNYHVLVNSFIYAGGDGYDFATYDPDGYDTAIHYRQPLLDWLLTQGFSKSMPINTRVDILGNP